MSAITSLALAMRLAEHEFQDLEALVPVLDQLAQPRLHHRVPDRGFVLVRKALGLVDRALHDGAQLRVLLRTGSRAVRSACAQQRSGGEASEPAASG
jgi:hypothetical protein